MVLIQFNRCEVKSVEEKTKEDDKGVSTTYTYKLSGARGDVTIKTSYEIPEFEQGKLIDVHTGDQLMKKLEDFSEEDDATWDEEKYPPAIMITILEAVDKFPLDLEKVEEALTEATPLWDEECRKDQLDKAVKEEFFKVINKDDGLEVTQAGRDFIYQFTESEQKDVKGCDPETCEGPKEPVPEENKMQAKRDEKAAEFEASENVQAILKGKCSDDAYDATIPKLLNAELQYCLMQEKRKTGRKKLIKEAKDRAAPFTNMTETLEV